LSTRIHLIVFLLPYKMKIKSPRDLQIKELKKIPGVGISIANDLINIGITKIDDLKNKDPQKLYDQSNKFAGMVQDRCLLYVFQCAVYYATETNHDTEKLKWWNWKEK
jgi:Pathogenicity locus